MYSCTWKHCQFFNIAYMIFTATDALHTKMHVPVIWAGIV